MAFMHVKGVVIVMFGCCTLSSLGCAGGAGEGEGEGEGAAAGEGEGEGAAGEGEGEGVTPTVLPSAVLSIPTAPQNDACLWDSSGGLINQVAGASFALAADASYVAGADPVQLRFVPPKSDLVNGSCADPEAAFNAISVALADAQPILDGKAFIAAFATTNFLVHIDDALDAGAREVIVIDDRCKGPLGTDAGGYALRGTGAPDAALTLSDTRGVDDVYSGTTTATGALTLVVTDAAGGDAATFDAIDTNASDRLVFVCSSQGIEGTTVNVAVSRCAIGETAGALSSLLCTSASEAHEQP